MLSKVYSSLELTCQLLKPTSSPLGRMKTQMLSPVAGWSAQLLSPCPGPWQQVTAPAHTTLLCPAWGTDMRKNIKESLDRMADESKSLQPNIHPACKPTPCLYPNSTGESTQVRRIAVAMAAHPLLLPFPLFRYGREQPVQGCYAAGPSGATQTPQHPVFSCHTKKES